MCSVRKTSGTAEDDPERPIGFQPSSYGSLPDSYFHDEQLISSLPIHRIARGWWQNGYQLSALCSIFCHLPETLRNVLVEGLTAVDCALAERRRCQLLPPPPLTTASVLPPAVVMGSAGLAEGDGELSDDFWAGVNYCGYFRTVYEPGSMRRNAIFINSAFAGLFGAHPEEVLARFQQREVPIANELDWICTMADDILRIREPVLTRHVRILKGICRPHEGSHEILITWTTRKTFDANGSMLQVRHWMTPVSEEDYDATMAAAPHLCRPFAAATGDTRRGAALLADAAADRETDSIAAMVATPAGLSRLAALAAYLAARFRDFVAAIRSSIPAEALLASAPPTFARVAAELPSQQTLAGPPRPPMLTYAAAASSTPLAATTGGVAFASHAPAVSYADAAAVLFAPPAPDEVQADDAGTGWHDRDGSMPEVWQDYYGTDGTGSF